MITLKELKELKEKHQLEKLTFEDTNLIRTLKLIDSFTEITKINIVYGKLGRLVTEIELKNYMIDKLIRHIKKGEDKK